LSQQRKNKNHSTSLKQRTVYAMIQTIKRLNKGIKKLFC